MSDLPPPPTPPSGWPPQGPPQQPPPAQWPGQAPAAPGGPGYGGPGYGGYGAPPAPPGQGPWGAPANYGYGAQSGPGYGAMKAGFWQRFVASVIIDGIIVTLFLVPAYVALFAGPKEESPCFVDSSGDIDPFEDDFANAICEEPSGAAWAMFGVLGLVGFAGALVYYANTQGKTGQTIGYKAMNIKLVDMQTGQPVGPGRAIGRFFARWISGIPCYLGYFWMLWDPQKQTWHDKMTNSVVVST